MISAIASGAGGLIPALGGALVFVLARFIRRPTQDSDVAVWRNAPGWARLVFGNSGGRIGSDNLIFEIFGLSIVATMGAETFLGAESSSATAALLNFLAVGAFAAAFVALSVSWIARTIRTVHWTRDGRRASQADLIVEPTPPEAVGLAYAPRLRDFYWMLQTSWYGYLVIGMTIFLIAYAPVYAAEGNYAVAAGMTIGAFGVGFGMPLWIVFNWYHQIVGATVRLTFDDHGVWGWPTRRAVDSRWSELRSARVESSVIVLRFGGALMNAVVIPARAVTRDDFEGLVAVLRAHGQLRRGDRRSLIGRAFDLISRPWRSGAPLSSDGRLTRFPRMGRS